MEYTDIIYEKADRILTITLNRPAKLNAVLDRTLDELIDAIDRADEDDEVRAVIITGAGRGFCAGAELGGDRFNYAHIPMEEHRDGGGLLTLRIYDAKKPLIAAINGPAVGVGVTMTLPMDVRLASEAAKFGFVFARRGIVPEACSSWFLPRVVGIGKATEWTLSGRLLDAKEALASGLVSEVTAPDALLPRARQIALDIAENTSAISVTVTRQLLWKMLGADHPIEAHKLESKSIWYLGQGADAHEATKAWVEKRKPDFSLKPSSDLPPFYPWWHPRSFD